MMMGPQFLHENGCLPGFDTDGDGNLAPSDEFVELFNTSNSDVDISGWTLNYRAINDSDRGTFTFPGALDSGTTILPAGEHVVIITEYTGTAPDFFFESGITIRLAGGEFVLSNGTDSIAVIHGGDNTATVANFDDFGDQTAGQSIQRSPDGSDTIVSATPTPECFLAGTLILTENGYKAVEELEIGDFVQTAEGKLEAVKWIGYQTINPEQIGNPLRGNPIQIKAGAFGNNLPLRDLYVSPDHAMFFDGLLINAGALVNDSSIVQTEPTETFVYHSVELENHCLLVVEGTAAESYLPQKEDRLNYDNGTEYDELYPHGSKIMLWPLAYPRVSSYTTVPRYVRKKLNAIAAELGLKAA